MAKHMDIQFIGHVTNQFEEKFMLVQFQIIDHLIAFRRSSTMKRIALGILLNISCVTEARGLLR